MSHVCCQIPVTLKGQEDMMFLAAKLSSTFFLETFIHAKEKPTMVQWMELLMKQLLMSQQASTWFLDQLATPENGWLQQILVKCPNQVVRQTFSQLCFHVVQNLRTVQIHLYMKMEKGYEFSHPDLVVQEEFGKFSCVTRFIKRFLSLVSLILKFFFINEWTVWILNLNLQLEQGAKSHLKHLAEYFTFLHDFTKLGDEECQLLINLQAISKMVNFYLGNKKEDYVSELPRKISKNKS